MPKGLRVFYQVYTLVAATIIFLSSLFLIKGPVRTANLIIIAPLAALAWINFSNPQKTSESIWSLRMLIIVFCLSALGLITLAAAGNTPEPVPQPAAEQVLPSPALSPNPTLLPTPTTPNPLDYVIGSVTITNPAGAILYLQPNSLNQSGQTASPQQTYPYLDFQDGWFKILLEASSSAWVKLEDVVP